MKVVWIRGVTNWFHELLPGGKVVLLLGDNHTDSRSQCLTRDGSFLADLCNL